MGKELLERSAQPLFDFGADEIERHRWQAVLQFQQIVRGLFADQIGAGGERLAQLDRRRADRAEGPGVIGLGGNPRAQPRDAEQPADLGRGLRRSLQTFQRTMPRKDAAPFEEPEDMRARGGHLKEPLPFRGGVGVGPERAADVLCEASPPPGPPPGRAGVGGV